MINPVSAAYLQSFFPLPTTAGLVNNFAANDVDQVNREQFNIRVDYARPKDQIFGRFSLNNSTLSLSRGTFNSGALPGFGDNDVINTRNFVLADDHTFNPSTVLDLCLVRAFRVNALYRFAEVPVLAKQILDAFKGVADTFAAHRFAISELTSHCNLACSFGLIGKQPRRHLTVVNKDERGVEYRRSPHHLCEVRGIRDRVDRGTERKTALHTTECRSATTFTSGKMDAFTK